MGRQLHVTLAARIDTLPNIGLSSSHDYSFWGVVNGGVMNENYILGGRQLLRKEKTLALLGRSRLVSVWGGTVGLNSRSAFSTSISGELRALAASFDRTVAVPARIMSLCDALSNGLRRSHTGVREIVLLFIQQLIDWVLLDTMAGATTGPNTFHEWPKQDVVAKGRALSSKRRLERVFASFGESALKPVKT